jgi:hypothetical protein
MCLTEADYSEDPALIHPEVVEAQLQDYEALNIQKWTRTCFANHKHCRDIGETGFVPTRLIDIGEKKNDRIRLVTTEG